MDLLFLPELFYQITTNLNDKEKIFLTSCSKMIYNSKSLLILDSKYNLEEINNKWRAKNIIIESFELESKIKELIEDLIPESIIINSQYVKFISNNTNIKLVRNEEIIKKLVLHECPRQKVDIFRSSAGTYLIMKIMLNNDGPQKLEQLFRPLRESIVNINIQFHKSLLYGYSDVMKLLIDLGGSIYIPEIVRNSFCSHLSTIKLLMEFGADIHAQDNRVIINASYCGPLNIIKLLTDSGAHIHYQSNQEIIYASYCGHLTSVRLLIKLHADVRIETIN